MDRFASALCWVKHNGPCQLGVFSHFGADRKAVGLQGVVGEAVCLQLVMLILGHREAGQQQWVGVGELARGWQMAAGSTNCVG